MRQVKLVVHECYAGKRKSEEVFAAVFLSKRTFQLTAEIEYADNSREYHTASFYTEIYNEWQFVCIPVVPKKTGTIENIHVHCSFYRNTGNGYFDDLALVKEPCASYQYNAEGHLTAVTQSGMEKQQFTYSGADLLSATGNATGPRSYTYDSRHNITSIQQAGLTMEMSYDSAGNVTQTAISPEHGYVTGASYTADGTRLATETDTLGTTVRYSYTNGNASTTTDAEYAVSESNYTTHMFYHYDTQERCKQAYKRTVVSLENTYLYGNLIKIQRRGNPLNSQNSNNLTAVQDYNFSYDIFQNRTQTAVGSRVLSTNTYDAYRTLQRSTYGNGVFVAYSYDALERLTGKENSDGEWRERYAYGTDGELIEKVITDKTSGAVEKTVHYEYDSLGRLICTEERGADGSILSRSEQGYTVKGQASAQSYFDGEQTRQSSYTYDDAGMLTGMQTGGGEQISYTYDYLNRLTRKTVGTTPYTYTYYAPYENLESALPHSILYQSTAGPVERFQVSKETPFSFDTSRRTSPEVLVSLRL